MMENRIAIVTGGSRGIGECTARELSKNGYTVCIVCKNNIEKSQTIASEINGFAYSCDIADKTSVSTLVNNIFNKFGRIDLLVNNAGVALTQLFHLVNDDDANELYGTNLFGTLNMTRCVLPFMISQKNGSIINISSIWGEVGASCEVDYSVTKSAIIGFTKALAKEVGPSNIRVNCVSPGVIDTDMMAQYNEQDKSELCNETPLLRIGLPIDVANAVCFLASDKSDFITGQVLSVGGGFGF